MDQAQTSVRTDAVKAVTVTEIQQHIEKIVEAVMKGGLGENTGRFDVLVEIRDEAQTLIDAERDLHHNALKAQAERLAKDLAAKKARLAGLDALVAGKAKTKATRSDAGKKRGPKVVPDKVA